MNHRMKDIRTDISKDYMGEISDSNENDELANDAVKGDI